MFSITETNLTYVSSNWPIFEIFLSIARGSIKKQMTCVLIKETNDTCFNYISKWHVFKLKKPMTSVSIKEANET